MKKSITSRIRITKNGKIVRRSMAVDHFRTRSTQKLIRSKRHTRGLELSLKAIKNYK